MPATFSVIIAFYNESRFLAEAIGSVLAQDLADWELLLVDDGSTDDSRAIANAYAQSDPRISVYGHPGNINLGVASARNVGLDHAVGDYVTFLDGDDYYLPDRLSSHLAELVRQPGLVAIYSQTRWINDEIGQTVLEDLGRFSGQLNPPPRLIERIILKQEGAVPCVCSITLQRAAVTALGGFEEDFVLYEDQTLWVKIFARYPVFVLNHCSAVYRQHSLSTSAAAVAKTNPFLPTPDQSHIKFLNWTERYLIGTRTITPHSRALIGSLLGSYHASRWVRVKAGLSMLWIRIRYSKSD